VTNDELKRFFLMRQSEALPVHVVIGICRLEIAASSRVMKAVELEVKQLILLLSNQDNCWHVPLNGIIQYNKSSSCKL
jgi:hypothetical protein